MGVPGLYRWLVDRYPNTLCSVAEDASHYYTGPKVDATGPNPNGVEFDNLYIDMNGLIHPCFHPEGGLPAPQSYDDVFKSIFTYIGRVFSIVRPRKLLFLAVDGVAPRAKMNHQRARRFTRRAAAGGGKLDSNVITPGTEFMTLLSSALKDHVLWRMNMDRAWRRIKVIISDSSVVGEGEDKIMFYIRSQRNLRGYDPNTRHCLHGLDADLVMLALATHEIHVSILREVITNGRIGKKQRSDRSKRQSYLTSMREFVHGLKFEFFNIWVLREYLEHDLLPDVEGTDFERLIDDFVFMCFFVGNDFLPRLPSLDISEGAIELLLVVYQEEFVKMGYLTNSPEVNLKSMEHFLQALGSHENAIFMKRCQVEMEKKKKKRKRGFQDSMFSVEVPEPYRKRRYYTLKFDCRFDDVVRIKRDAVLKYTEGVCWVMHYYYQGVRSWQWFYPYHYAPFASDFSGLDKLELHFTLGQPFKPLDQLLAVLPAARELMTKKSSPILDFYPKTAKVDRNGKKHAWQGVCRLPFIEESRLLSETLKVEHTLTDEEKERNRLGRDMLFVNYCHPLAKRIPDRPKRHQSSEMQIKIKQHLSGGMNGYLFISDKPACPHTIHSPVDGRDTILRNDVKSVDFQCPSHAHVTKLLPGIRMPPKILRSQDFPRPPALWHATPGLSQSIVSESLTKHIEKKRKRDVVPRSCIDESLAHATEPEMQDHGVNGSYTNNEARYEKQKIYDGIINQKLVGQSEAEVHLVEGGETISEASRNCGNKSTNENGISDETQRDKQVKCEKRKQGKKRVRDHKLESEVQIVEGRETISEASQNWGHISTNDEHGKSDETQRDKQVKGENRKQGKKRVRDHKLESEVHLVGGEDKVSEAGQNSIKVEPKNMVESVLPLAEERDGKGEVHLVEGTEKICGAVQNMVKVEVNERPSKGMGSFVAGEIQSVAPEHIERRVKGEQPLFRGIFKIIGPSQSSADIGFSEKPTDNMESDLACYDEGHGVRQKVNVDGVEVGERPTNGTGSFVGGETQSVAPEHTKPRVKGERPLFRGIFKIIGPSQSSVDVGVSEKPTNKMDSDLAFQDEDEHRGEFQKVNVEGGEILTNKIDCDIVLAKGKEIKGGENEGKQKRKKQKMSKQSAESISCEQKVETSGLDQNSNGFEVNEKATNKQEHDIWLSEEQEIVDGENEHFTKPRRDKLKKRKQVKADMMGAVEEKGEVDEASQVDNVNASEKPIKRLESDLPHLKEQENVSRENEATNGGPEHKRKKHKSKRVQDEMLGAELHLSEKKVEIAGASQSQSSKKVEVSEIPKNMLDSDLLIPREQDTVSETTTSVSEPNLENQRKRRR